MLNDNQQGFSLVEILVVSAIILVLTYVMADYVRMGFVATRYSNEQNSATIEARRAMEIMTREIRGANQSELGDYPLLTLEEENIIFFSDNDDDNEMEKIRYHVEGTTLYKNVNEPGPAYDYNTPISTTTISLYVNNQGTPLFSYYNDANATTSIINDVKMVGVNLLINVTPEILPNDYIIESNVNLRNLKNN